MLQIYTKIFVTKARQARLKNRPQFDEAATAVTFPYLKYKTTPDSEVRGRKRSKRIWVFACELSP